MNALPCLPLAGEMTIGMAAALRAQLLASLPQPGETLALDLAEVEACDSSGVQLLLALRHSLRARGGELLLQAPAPSVRHALATYGLDGALQALHRADDGRAAP